MTSGGEELKALWLDDLIGRLGGMLEAFEDAGISVDGASNPRDAVAMLAESKYDLVIVDLMLQGAEDGLWFLEHLESQGVESLPPVVVLSSFIYLPNVMDALSMSGVPAQLVDKLSDGDFDEQDRVDSLVEEIRDVAGLDELSSLSEQVEGLRNSVDNQLSPLELSRAVFEGLTTFEQTEVEDAADELLGDDAERLFRDGALWAFYCGAMEPVAVAYSLEERSEWSPEMVEAYAKQVDRVSFTFESGYRPEDLPSFRRPSRRGGEGVLVSTERPGSKCDGVLYDYPTVELRFDQAVATSVIHFDTGLDVTMFSLEHLKAIGALRGNPDGRPERRQFPQERRPVRYYEIPFTDVKLMSGSENGQTMIVELAVRAVPRWDRIWLARTCGEHECRAVTQSGICEYRAGLAGRSVVTDNNLRIRIADS